MKQGRVLVAVLAALGLGACFDFQADYDEFCRGRAGVAGCPPGDGGPAGDDAGVEVDAGQLDAGAPDAGVADGGEPGPVDAGELDGGTADAGADDGGTDGGTAVDAGPGPAPCSVSTVTGTDGIFVTPQGNDQNVGNPLAPVKSLARGIQLAAMRAPPRRVFLGPGTWNEALSLDSQANGVRVEGGWLGGVSSWTKNCVPARAADVRVNALSPTAVVLSGVTQEIAFEDLVVTSTTADAGSSASGYGFVVRDSALSLVNVTVQAGPGTAALVPARPAPQGNACVSLPVGSCSTGDAGVSPTGSGGPGSSGAFTPAGFAPSRGSNGVPGGSGVAGTAPPVPSPVTCMPGCNGECQSMAGQCLNQPSESRSGAFGTCGCGGVGGGAGVGALGGGASVAMLVSGSSTVSLRWTTLLASEGGAGAAGGLGGLGGSGTDGGAGANGVCHDPNVAQCGAGGTQGTPTCGCAVVSGANTRVVPGGGAGGRGGAGATGSNGGGSAGGPSHALVRVGSSASITIGPAVELTPASGGAGAGGAANGASGARLEVP